MNLFAYRTTGLLIKTITELSKAKIKLYGIENIPNGSVIFVLNHFTRMETFLMPYVIFKLTRVPVWSLASYEFFKGAFGAYLDKVGAVSTRNPERDLLIVKTLLTGEANWIIFPEGRMVKNKKIIEKGRFMISFAGGKRPGQEYKRPAGDKAKKMEVHQQDQAGKKNNIRGKVHAGCLMAFFIVTVSDIGLNLSDLTNCIKVMVLDQNALSPERLYEALTAIRAKLNQPAMPVLLYPVSYADRCSIPYSKQYILWTLRTHGQSDKYFQYLNRLLRIS
jgi:hypothetical protein